MTLTHSFSLYSYWRSTAAYRVRIALNLKGLQYAVVPVHLLRDGGEHKQSGYRELNPQGLVPALVDGDVALGQSLAIMEYLEELQPEPALLPATPAARARVRALAQNVACDIHPLNNLRVLKYLTGVLGISEDDKRAWYRHWIAEGFSGLEASLAGDRATGAFCHGETPTLADICLVAQVYNARRFDCDLEAYPNIRRIDATCLKLPAFDQARPELQPDAT